MLSPVVAPLHTNLMLKKPTFSKKFVKIPVDVCMKC